MLIVAVLLSPGTTAWPSDELLELLFELAKVVPDASNHRCPFLGRGDADLGVAGRG